MKTQNWEKELEELWIRVWDDKAQREVPKFKSFIRTLLSLKEQEVKEDIKELILLENIPHLYQERLLKLLTPKI